MNTWLCIRAGEVSLSIHVTVFPVNVFTICATYCHQRHSTCVHILACSSMKYSLGAAAGKPKGKSLYALDNRPACISQTPQLMHKKNSTMARWRSASDLLQLPLQSSQHSRRRHHMQLL